MSQPPRFEGSNNVKRKNESFLQLVCNFLQLTAAQCKKAASTGKRLKSDTAARIQPTCGNLNTLKRYHTNEVRSTPRINNSRHIFKINYSKTTILVLKDKTKVCVKFIQLPHFSSFCSTLGAFVTCGKPMKIAPSISPSVRTRGLIAFDKIFQTHIGQF